MAKRKSSQPHTDGSNSKGDEARMKPPRKTSMITSCATKASVLLLCSMNGLISRVASRKPKAMRKAKKQLSASLLSEKKM